MKKKGMNKLILNKKVRTIDKKKNIIKKELEDLKKWNFDKNKVIDYELQDDKIFLNIINNLEVETLKIDINYNNKEHICILYEFLTEAFEHLNYIFEYNIGRGISNYYKSLFLELLNKTNYIKEEKINCFHPLIESEVNNGKKIKEFSFRIMKATDIFDSLEENEERFLNCTVTENDKNEFNIIIYGKGNIIYSKKLSDFKKVYCTINILITDYSIYIEIYLKELEFKKMK